MKYLATLIVIISLIGFIGYIFNPQRIVEAERESRQYIYEQQQKAQNTLTTNN